MEMGDRSIVFIANQEPRALTYCLCNALSFLGCIVTVIIIVN